VYWAFPAIFLCLILPGRAGVAVDIGLGAAGVATTVVLFALPLLYTLPRGRVWWDRHRGWLLATQAVLTYTPFLVFGQKWAVGLAGLLGGLLLLTLPTRVSWPLFAGILAVEGVLRIGVLGIYPGAEAYFYTWVFVVPVDLALPLFGLVRLADLVTESRAARTELARLAVAQERLRAAGRLRAAVGDRLDVVTERAGAALAMLPDAPDRARALLREAAGIARQAVNDVRATVDDQRDPGPVRPAGLAVAPRLARLVLTALLVAFCGHHLVLLAASPAGPVATAVGATAIVALGVLQLYHSLGWRAGARPRGWRVTLAVQSVLPLADPVHFSLLGLPGFPAGSALLLLTGWRAALTFGAVAASTGVFWALRFGWTLDDLVYTVGLAASTGLAVYGLSRLADQAEELEATRRELARAAVEQERLRVAQDTHDLLGLGLSAVALKCDLADRLLGRADPRARDEIDSLIRLAARAGADVRAVTTGGPELSLRAELAAAREVLASAGVDVEVRVPAFGVPLPYRVDTVLATVLRESVTNLLRHATATRCEIELSAPDGVASLRVVNDGVPVEPEQPVRAPRSGGRGLANLAARAGALGGRLTAYSEEDRFLLSVRIPLSRREDAFAAGHPAHGVDEVVGGAVLGEESGDARGQRPAEAVQSGQTGQDQDTAGR
jgi:two-component system, NarL family, sensor histidine kinase DesK